MDISIVIPFYNEEKNVRQVLQGLSSILDNKSINYEIIAVDNNSKDHTGKIIQAIKKNNPKLIHLFEKNLGYGNAIRTGLKSATGKWIGWIDGDMQIHPQDVWRVIDRILISKTPFIMGERRIRYDGIIRYISTRVFRLFISILIRQWIFDINGKPKFFLRSWYEKIKINAHGWFIDTEIVNLYLRSQKIKKIETVPIFFYSRKQGRSSVHFWMVFAFIKEAICYLKP